MSQLSVTCQLNAWVTEEQYNVLLQRISDLLEQYGHMFSSVSENNVPPSMVQVPILVKVAGLSIAEAQTLVATKVTTGFGSPPTAPVVEVDISPAL
jgi:hypothetical protein